MSDTSRSCVLIVDDDPNIRELLTDALTADDVELVVTDSVGQAQSVAAEMDIDLVVADLYLSDGLGTDVIGQLRKTAADVPAVLITGCDEADAMALATRVGLVEVMTKPLDMARLQQTVRKNLDLHHARARSHHRTLRLRDLAREMNIERKMANEHLETTCADLTAAYKSLSGQMALQQIVLGLQNDLVAAKSDDDVFRSLFQLFVKRSGPVNGIAMVCDEDAQLRIIGRFGVPSPDGLPFCRALVAPMVERTLENPECLLLDAGADPSKFSPSIQKYLPGLTILTMPLIPEPGELIGLVVLYRKGEQPFTDMDCALAEMAAHPAALAVRRND